MDMTKNQIILYAIGIIVAVVGVAMLRVYGNMSGPLMMIGGILMLIALFIK